MNLNLPGGPVDISDYQWAINMQQEYSKVMTANAQNQQSSGGEAPSQNGEAPKSDGDVIDGEFTEKS